MFGLRLFEEPLLGHSSFNGVCEFIVNDKGLYETEFPFTGNVKDSVAEYDDETNMISLKFNTEKTDGNSKYSSSYEYSFSVPKDADASTIDVVQEDGRIVIRANKKGEQ